MRSHWIRTDLNSNKYPYKRQKRTYREGKVKDRGKVWGDAATSPGMPRTASSTRSWERGMGWIFPQNLQKESPAHTLILDFWPQEL